MIKIEASGTGGEVIEIEFSTPQEVADYIVAQADQVEYWEFDATPEDVQQIFFLMTGEIPDETLSSCAIS